MDVFQAALKEEFAGTAFGLTTDKQSRPVRVRFTGSGLALTLPEAGQPARTLPYPQLRLSLGGYGGRQLVLDAETPQGRITVYLPEPEVTASLMQNAPPELRSQVEEIDRARRSNRRWGLFLALGCLGLLAALVVGTWWSIDPLVGMAVDQIPVDWEKNLGQAALQEMLKQQKVVQDPELRQALDEIGQRLVGAAGSQLYTFHFVIVESGQVNAFALPGGQVVVFTALLAKSDGPEEVAGVLAHEMQHVLRRHSLKRLVRNLGFVAAAQIAFGDVGGFLALTSQLATDLMLLKFDRGQESEADRLGLELLIAARIDPQGLPAFFEKMAREEGQFQEAMSFASTHPGSADRAEDLRQKIAAGASGPPEPFSFEWAGVREKAKAFTPAD